MLIRSLHVQIVAQILSTLSHWQSYHLLYRQQLTVHPGFQIVYFALTSWISITHTRVASTKSLQNRIMVSIALSISLSLSLSKGLVQLSLHVLPHIGAKPSLII